MLVLPINSLSTGKSVILVLTLETTLHPTCSGALGYLVVYFSVASSLLNINKGYRMISTVLDNGLAALESTE